jgi:hypothetical protein
LNCTAQQIFFSSPPIPVLAAVFHWNDDCVTKQAEKSAPILLGSHGGKNPELIMGHRLELPRMAPLQKQSDIYSRLLLPRFHVHILGFV